MEYILSGGTIRPYGSLVQDFLDIIMEYEEKQKELEKLKPKPIEPEDEKKEEEERLARNRNREKPDWLKSRIANIRVHAINYRGRASDMLKLECYMSAGDYSSAAMIAEHVMFNQLSSGGEEEEKTSEEVKREIKRIEAESIDYPSRASDVMAMKGFADSGNSRMALAAARSILSHQNNTLKTDPCTEFYKSFADEESRPSEETQLYSFIA